MLGGVVTRTGFMRGRDSLNGIFSVARDVFTVNAGEGHVNLSFQ